MPQIPRYNRQVITEQADNTQENLNFNANQFGASLGNAIANVGDTYGKFKIEADTTKAKEAFNQYTRAAQEKLDLDLLNRENRNAIGVKQVAEKEFNTLKQNYGKALSPSQKSIFNSLAGAQDNTFYSALNKHEVKQIGAYEDDVYKSTIDTQREQATFNATDFGVVNKYIADQENEIAGYAQKKGLVDPNDPTVLQNVLLTETSKTRRAVLERLIDSQNVVSAEEFFGANQDKMTEADSTAVRKALEEGMLTKKAQDEADRLIQSGGGVEAAIKSANKIEDVKLRDEVKKRVIGFEQEISQAEKLDQENIYIDGWNKMEANPKVMPKDLVGASKWAKLSPAKRKAMDDFYNAGGAPKQSNLDTFYEIQLMAGSRATRDKFLTTDLREYKSVLNDTDFKYFAKLQSDALSGKASAQKDLDGIETKESIMKGAMVQSGIVLRGNKTSLENRERESIFRKMVDDEIVAQQEATGKKVTNDDVRKITNKLAAETIVGPGAFWGVRKKRLFDVDATDVNRIEPEVRVKIEESLKRAKRPVSPANIMSVYDRIKKDEE